MLSSVSPVITGAEAASPQPTTPLSVSIRTSTLSARRTSSPAMMTGLSIGRLTAIGSIVLIFIQVPADDSLQLLDPGLVDDAPEQIDLVGHARPRGVRALWSDLEASLIQLFFHFLSGEDLKGFRFQPLHNFGRCLRGSK